VTYTKQRGKDCLGCHIDGSAGNADKRFVLTLHSPFREHFDSNISRVVTSGRCNIHKAELLAGSCNEKVRISWSSGPVPPLIEP
jgi:hypothetical protein